MSQAFGSLIGRASELEQLSSAVRDAIGRRGSVWLITGEAGIGKSRLVEEAARRATETSALTLFGRCWEAGGAPSFWPWIQVVRALARQGAAMREAVVAGGRARYLQQVLPELVGPSTERAELPALSPDQARFQLLDAFVGSLCDAAEEVPLVVVLDDMHAADASSLAVLELLAGQIGAARLTVFATARDLQPLARVGRAARRLSLDRMSRDDVDALLRAESRQAPPPGAADTLHRWTEGNALFLVETARWLLAHGELERLADATQPALPATVLSAIGERLADLSAPTREVLSVASVIGREVDARTLAAVAERDPSEVTAALDEAVDAAVMHRTALGALRFGHILIREALYRSLAEATRGSLHARIAARLDAERAEPAIAAHHWSCAGDAWRERASLAYERAAEQALAQLALDEAAGFFADALASCGPDRARAAELALGLGRAAMLVGDAERCIDACRRAVAIARELEDADLLARAALTRGGIFTYGVVDPEMVATLREALAALDEGDGTLRARVLARLAAALQPADDPSVPIQMARDAIAMARRTGDERTLLDALRSGCSALMDLGEPRERMALNAEHVALAGRLGDPVEALRGNMRLCFDAWELGEDATASAAVEACDRLATELDHPFHRWRATALLAARAMRAGRFAEAERLWESARAESQTARDPNAQNALLMHRFSLLRVQGRFAELDQLLPEIDELAGRIGHGSFVSACMIGAEHARTGRLEEARLRFDPHVGESVLALGDLSLLSGVAQAAARLRMRPLCLQAYGAAVRHAGRFVSWGVMGMAVEGPVDHLLGILAMALDRFEDAERHFERAVELARDAGTPPWIAWARLDEATMLADAVERGTRADERERIEARLREAEAIARELGMPGLLTAADALRRQVPDAIELDPSAPASLSLEREGNTWTIRGGARVLHVEDTRGMQMLAHLVAHPTVDVHALDLSGRPDPGERRDAGDAGELIDVKARAAYRRRVVELREELAEAEAWNDAGRVDRARLELEMLEAELSRALGLGGRPRRARADSERARVNVQRRIKDAIARIGALDPGLGQHLAESVRTGTFCSYDPAR